MQEHLLDPLATKLLAGDFKPGDKIKVTAKDERTVAVVSSNNVLHGLRKVAAIFSARIATQTLQEKCSNYRN